MAKLSQYFLQSLSLNGVVIPREWVVEAAYLEGLNLTFPLLLVKIRDVSGAVIDNGKLKKGSELVAELGDGTRGGPVFKETFYVVEAPVAQDAIHVTAIAKDVQRLLVPAAQPRFFTNKQPAEIIRQLAPGLTTSADVLNKTGTWHLNMAQKPAVLFKQIAQDTGAMCWVARKTINFKSVSNLLNQRPTFEYEYNNPKAKHILTKIRNVNQESLYTSPREYRYMAYHDNDGLKVAGDASLPVKMISDPDLGVLQNKHVTIIPVLDAEMSGNPGLQAGQVVNVILHRYDKVNRMDESVPKKMIVERVTHFENQFVYRSRVILGIPFEPEGGISIAGFQMSALGAFFNLL
ncbi:TPA: tail length tape measure protein [Enterobacter cloacae]